MIGVLVKNVICGVLVLVIASLIKNVKYWMMSIWIQKTVAAKNV